MSSFNPEYDSYSSQCCTSYFSIPTVSGLVNRQDGYYRQAKEEIDSTLAQSMAQLSFEERQMGQEDLHGVSEAIVEDKAHIDGCLKDLDLQLDSIKHGSDYEMAETMDSFHVRDRGFRLSFLRSNRYNAKNAAKQMLNFFNMKRQLFGREKLTKEITFSDLSEDDKDCLKTGCMQILQTTDRAGRQILFQCPGLRQFKTVENELRARFYICMCLWKSEDTQRKGMVYVTYAIGRFQDKMNGAGFVETTKLIMAFPLYIAGIHRCTDHVTHFILGKTSLGMMPMSTRARTKYHLGSDQECQYILSTYGIPRQTLPLDPMTNEPKLNGFLVWYNQQQWKEVENGSQIVTGAFLRPRANDVLFVSSQTMNNAGNDLLRTLVRKRYDDYDLVSNEKKTAISDEIISEIKRNGGRFLKQDALEGSWKEVDVNEIRRKTKQMLRNYRHKLSNRSKANPVAHHRIAAKAITLDQVHPNDILFGTPTSKNHEGNILLRQVVRDLASEYDSATRAGKTQLTELIMRQSREMGSRFLKQSTIDANRWEALPDDVARSKISKLFRNIRRSSKPT
eukprot:scaffold6708_cov134-Cylindrotheca_fusiformis.AAC.13